MFRWPIDIARMKKNLGSSRADLDRLRFHLMKSQLINAFENVPFYYEAYRRIGVDPAKFSCIQDLNRYPVVTRPQIQNAANLFLSIKRAPEKLSRSHSSGSTGTPLWVYFDTATWFRKKYFSKLRSRMACGMKPNDKTAIFDTDPPESASRLLKNKVFSTPIFKARWFSIFQDAKAQVADLAAYLPRNLDSLPSHLFQLAQTVQNRKTAPTVKRIFTSSEYLEPHTRRYLQTRYSAEVFDIYGCTELKEVAWECDHHDGYHINEDEVYVEILNDQEPAEPGQIGDIVLTDLRNTAMPLIRYRIGDRGRLLPGRCDCNIAFARMAPAAGRSSDFLITPDGRRISPYRFTTAIEKIDGLLQYQLVQENVHGITVKAVMAENTNAHLIIEQIKGIDGLSDRPLQVVVEICHAIDVEENGKFKVVKNMMKGII
jgi:phenylacetate-CoA ligase